MYKRQQIFNPSEVEEVSVDIEIYSDFKDSSFIEPVSIEVSPGTTETIVLGGEEALNISRSAYDLTSRIPSGSPHWIVVRVISGPSIVSERFVFSDGSFPQMTASGFGVDVMADSHNFISSEGDELVAISHTSDDRLVQLKLLAFSGGELYESLPFEISAVSRKVINLNQFGIPADSVIELISSEPVLVERYIGSSKGGYWTRVLPAASSLSEPYVPLQ